jgi:chemotaxis protein MotA
MTLLLGWGVTLTVILVGFLMAGGNPAGLFVVSEWLVVGGCGVGFLIAASPPSVLKLLLTQVIRSCKGSPYKKDVYIDLVHMLYEIFLVGRQQGIIGLETHVLEPQNSPIIQKYPSFLNDHHAVEFFMDTMKPVIDGKLKAEQLKSYLDEQIVAKDNHAYSPVSVVSKVADALPGLGIVAAVLGIIITMGHIDGPVKEIGHHVASALVGTFLGVFLSYGVLQPLASNIEFLNHDELAYYSIIRTGIVSFGGGVSPLTAGENMRGSIPEDRRPKAEELEAILKGNAPGK